MGDRREVLEQIKTRLTSELAVAEGRDLAPLARELRATLADLDTLPVPDAKAPADEIAERRERRRREASAG